MYLSEGDKKVLKVKSKVEKEMNYNNLEKDKNPKAKERFRKPSYYQLSQETK